MPDGHPALPAGEWWACERPEAAPTALTAWHHDCAPCRLSLAVAALNMPWLDVSDDTVLGLPAGRHDALQVAVMLAEHYADAAMARVIS